MKMRWLNKKTISWTVPLLGFLLLAACSTVAITGRDQLTLIPNSQLMGMSYDQYSQVLNEYQVVSGTRPARAVRVVGEDIQGAVEEWFREQGMEDQLAGYEWEFNLLKDDDMVNAFAMPGGKVAVFTGMIPVAKTPTGLAVVMGHEIAHAVAEHGNERMSQALIQQLGGVALAVAIRDKPQQTQMLFMAAYGLGTQIGVMLPYSRTHESEADRLGLIFMAMAGYDPHVAPQFWQRMAETGGAQPPEFLSTHPSHETRVENLNNWMDEAMEYYQPKDMEIDKDEEFGG